jgi:hypothetical protein
MGKSVLQSSIGLIPESKIGYARRIPNVPPIEPSDKKDDMSEQQAARNQFKRVYKYIAWGGMPMATISVHEDDFNEDPFSKKAEKELGWQNIRVEICVGGSCVGTTLDKIMEAVNKLQEEKDK